MATETLSEAEKMRRVPGIVFADGPVGRRARVAGTGLDVWEIINEYRICGHDRAAVAEVFETLSLEQLQAAYDYYEAFPKEIDERLASEEKITPEYLRARFPQPNKIRQSSAEGSRARTEASHPDARDRTAQ
jgi:uncharacterized protein (DUF433 family)